MIRSHLLPHATHAWHGHTFDLTGAVLPYTDFSEIVVEQGTELNFCGTTLIGLINFRNIHLRGGLIDFAAAKLREAIINFPEATFEAGRLDFFAMEFRKGDRITFHQSRFAGAIIQFNTNSFDGGQVDLRGADFQTGLVEFAMPVCWNSPPLLPKPMPEIVCLPQKYESMYR